MRFKKFSMFMLGYVVCSVFLIMAFFKLSTNVSPVDEDYKLKFVSVDDMGINLVDAEKFILPIDVKSAFEQDGVIYLEGKKGEVVFSPMTCDILDSHDGSLKLKSGDLLIEIDGIVCGRTKNEKLHCGEIVGTIKENLLKIKVWYKERQLSLEEIKNCLKS